MSSLLNTENITVLSNEDTNTLYSLFCDAADKALNTTVKIYETIERQISEARTRSCALIMPRLVEGNGMT